MEGSRDLITRMLRGEAVERVGLNDNIWPLTLETWVEQGYPTDEAGEPVPPFEHFGFDLAPVRNGMDLEPRRGEREVIEETDDWIVVRDGAGAAFKRWKTRVSTPEHVDFRMNCREVWERDYRPFVDHFDPTRLNFDAPREGIERARRSDCFSLMGSAFIWEYMRHCLGDVNLYTNLLMDPDWIRDFGRVYTDFYKAHLGAVFDEVGPPDGYRMCEDMGYSAGLFASPDVLGNLIFPYFEELVDFFHERGALVILHTCGGVTEALDLIAEAGFDGLDPMENKAGCDPFDFAERFGDRLVLKGGLNKRVLESGDFDLIRREAGRLIDGMKSRGARYIFGSDHSISTLVTYDAFRIAVDAWREHRDY